MTTHKRTRTGCHTCRAAGYKCDERKPFCGRCTRLKITCEGYGIKLKWQDDNLEKRNRQSRRKATNRLSPTSPVSIASASSAPAAFTQRREIGSSPDTAFSLPATPNGPPGSAFDLPWNDRRLLHYWIKDLSLLISLSPRTTHGTPFQLHLTSMACNSPALRSTVLSMAATHLALVTQDPALRFQAYRHQQDAIHQLQDLIQDPIQAQSEPALATVLMMQLSARLFGEDDGVNIVNHLFGAKAMIARRGGVEAWSNSSSARFLLSLFAYHDILSSISRGHRPLLDHASEFTAVEASEDMQGIAAVLLLVARTSLLQHTIKTRLAQPATTTPPPLTKAEDATGRSIQYLLLNLDFSATVDPAIQLTAEAYRHAAFIYLYRTWLGVGAPNPISVTHIQQCLDCIAQIDVASPLVSSHVWPLFTAGCEAVDPASRRFVRDRFKDMFVARRFPSWGRVARDVEEVWRAKDKEGMCFGGVGMERVDCIQVILGRGREVDLA